MELGLLVGRVHGIPAFASEPIALVVHGQVWRSLSEVETTSTSYIFVAIVMGSVKEDTGRLCSTVSSDEK